MVSLAKMLNAGLPRCLKNLSSRTLNGFPMAVAASFSSEPKPKDKKLYWRESATVLIAKPTSTPDPNSKSDVEFLITARSEKAKFMPGGLCFPGGNVSSNDFSAEWLELYKKFTTEQIKNFSWLEPTAHKPEIYLPDDSAPAIPKEVSFRITAIRETFEECGLLLCRPASGSSDTPTTTELSDDEIVKWQNRIKGNSKEFLTLCHDLKVLPSIHALYEWNNWLTPKSYSPTKKGQPRRFDTIFYMTILTDPKSPKIIIDTHEVGSFVWSTSYKLLEEHVNELHKLMPPQLYEIGRLRNVNMTQLKELIETRRRLGIQRWCPYIRMADDGAFGTLPGDDLMPQDYEIYEYEEMQKVEKTLQELEKSSTTIHRWQIESDGKYRLIANTHSHGQKYHSDENVRLTDMKLYS